MTNNAGELEAVWYLGYEGLEGAEPNPEIAFLAITDPGDRPPVDHAGWGAFTQIGFADGEYDESVIRLMGAEEFERSFADYFNADRSRAIRRFVTQVSGRDGIEELYVFSPHGRSRAPAVALWAARTCSAALRPDLTDIPNELVLALLADPAKFEDRIRIAKRRAKEHFVAEGAPEDTLSMWAQKRAEQWLVSS